MTMMLSLPKMRTSYSPTSHLPVKEDSTTSLSLGGGFALLLCASNLHLQPSRIQRRSFLCLCETQHGPRSPNLQFPIVCGVVIGIALVPPIRLLFLMGFLGYLIVVFPQLNILFLILQPLTLTTSYSGSFLVSSLMVEIVHFH